MNIGIAGFSGCGKSTVFHWLTGKKPDPAAVQRGGHIGEVDIPDDRLDWLAAHFHPRSLKHARMALLDLPGLDPSERRDNPRRLGLLRDAGGLLVILDGFSGGDLADQLRRFREELLFADLEVVSNRVSRLEELLKKPRPARQKEADQAELDLLRRILEAFEKGQQAATLKFSDDEEKAIRSLALLTLKPEVVLINLGDKQLGQSPPPDLLALAPLTLPSPPGGEGRVRGPLQAPARLELELSELSEEDRQEFMEDLGLTGLTAGSVLRDIYYGMGQIVFFTVGEDECRAWNLLRGASALEGAAQVHKDLAKNFVRAEVVSFEDFRRVGSMKEAKHHGVYRLEGKTYVVQDGDIMHIL
jgi:ribosome-binding ATPase YchF (GTP1/OBG family)